MNKVIRGSFRIHDKIPIEEWIKKVRSQRVGDARETHTRSPENAGTKNGTGSTAQGGGSGNNNGNLTSAGGNPESGKPAC